MTISGAGTARVLLLDRDGVLNVDRSDSVKSVDELELLPGSEDAVQRLARAGYALLVVTNQSVVGRGLITRAALDAIDDELDRRLGGVIAGWFICPHGPGEGCACRKPGTALLEQAHEAWGFEPSKTWFVVDAERDLEAARRFGCRAALVRTGKGLSTEQAGADVPVFADLAGFVDWLLGAPPA